jgi:RNA polymerase sigma-70 factor (ECF subfamily)
LFDETASKYSRVDPHHEGALARDEDKLVRDFQDGDDLAFVTLYNRYKRLIYIFCLKMLFNADAAKDCVQEVFLRAYERREQLNEPQRFSSWLYSIARNQCLSIFRRSKHDATQEIDFDLISGPSGETPDALMERQESVDLLNKSLAQLNLEYREVLVLREFQNLSYREIAEVLGDSESAVKSRIFKARQRLFELLRPILRERG